MKNRYEFCYLDHERRPMFCVMWDENLLSACERLLCRVIEPTELDVTPSGNYILRGWLPTEWISVKETNGEASATFSLGTKTQPQFSAPVINLNIGDLDLSKSK
jgi:hypothetical protein